MSNEQRVSQQNNRWIFIKSDPGPRLFLRSSARLGLLSCPEKKGWLSGIVLPKNRLFL